MESSELVDVIWLLTAAAMVMLMQAGFLCLESGLVRSKNSINVAIKNFVDFCISSAVFWVFGFALMFGASQAGLFGASGFLFQRQDSPWVMAFFVFQLVFCGTATTIVSGAVAERLRFVGYVAIAIILSSAIYPVVGHWVWGGLVDAANAGWLERRGFVDFAGSTVVHSVGGWVSLAAIMVIGPRVGRFSGGPPIRGHDLPLATLGVFLLWFGWFGFNGGSTLRASAEIPYIVLNTTLSGAFGGLSALVLTWRLTGKPDVGMIMNGSLGGLVAITASANVIPPTSAVIVGLIGGGVVFAVTELLERARLDDVVGAVPVHAGGGLWGTFSVALLADPEQLGTGLSRLEQLGVQATGAVATFVWAFGVGYVALRIVNRWIELRASDDDQRIGLNVSEHGASTELIDLLTEMGRQQFAGSLLDRVSVEPHTEVGQVAQQYNLVLDRINDESQRRDAAVRALREKTSLVQLLQKVATAANEAKSPEEAMQTCLDAVCRHNDWPVGHVYVLAEDAADELVPTPIWHMDDPGRYEPFRRTTEDIHFGPGVGLPGRVLASGKPAWTGDFADNLDLPRAHVARDVGIRSGMALPVLVGHDVVAVLEFFSPDIVGPDDTLLEIMGSVGTQLGRVVERKQAEETRFKAVVDNMPAVISLRDRDGRFMLINRRYEEFTDLTNASVRGKTLYDVFSKEDADNAARLDRQVLETRQVVEGEIVYTPDGRPRILQAVKFPILDAEGEVTAVAGIELDITERKEAEQALAQASEAKDAAIGELQAVLDTIDYGVLFVDADLRLRLANRAYRQIWSIPADFITPEHSLLDDLLLTRSKKLYGIEDDDWDDYVAARLAEIRQGRVGPVEIPLADGRVLQYQCIKLPDGGRMLTYFDITDLKTAEAAWRASEKRLVDAIESISESFALTDANDRMVIYNNRYREVFFPGHEDLVRLGETFEALLRANVESDMIKMDTDDVAGFIRERMARHRDPSGPFVQEQSDGRWIQINERKTDEGGIVAVGTDITELKQHEEALRESEERYALAMAGANEGLWDWQPDTGEIIVSENMRALLGLPGDTATITPADWEARVHPEDIAQHRAAIRAHLRGETEHFTSEYRVRGPGGEYRWVHNRGLGLRDENGRVYRMAGSLGDVTARKNAEFRLKEARDQAMQATQAKSQFLANMSHELRTPMNAIIGFTQLVMERSGDALPKRQQDNLGKILVSAEHLLALINDILDLSKIEAGHMDVSPQDFDLAKLIEMCVKTVEPMIAGRDLSVHTDLPTDLPTLHTDQGKLRQILINLLSNAVKFTDAGTVKVTVREADDMLQIAVQDTGIGIAEDALDYVYDEFRQVDESSTRRYGGTGLGLAITRRLALLLGGSISAESTLGAGSTFTVLVPPRYAAEEAASTAEPSEHD